MVPRQLGGLEARTLPTGTGMNDLTDKMGIGRLFGRGKSDEMSRRDFLKKGTSMTAGGYLAAKGFGMNQEAEAYDFSKVEVPAGIETDAKVDPAVKWTYQLHQKDVTMIHFNYKSSERVAELRLMRQGAVGEDLPKRESYWMLPSLWLMAGEWNVRGGVYEHVISEKELKEKNEAMHYFSVGIDWFFSYWDQGYRANYQVAYLLNVLIDENLGTSLLTAAGRKNAKKEYEHFKYDMAEDEQRRYLSELYNQIMKRDDTQKRTALWAATWIINHLLIKKEDKSEEKAMYLINEIIEVPLWDSVGRVRAEKGGPTYMNNYI